MTQNQTKIQGKFYPLQHEEFLSACHQLTPAQLMVLYFLRTLDPYDDGVEVSVSEMARRLSTESKEVHRSTVSRALKALDEKGFIDLELVKVKVKVSPRGLHCCDETTVLPTDNSVAYRQQARSPRNKRDRDATSVISTQHARSSRNNQEPEPLPDNDSSPSKTIKTYSDFKDSLSQEERESFLEFGLKKASQLPRPPELPLKWVEKNWEDLRIQWEKSQGRVSSSKASKWENHPQREEWLEKIRHLGPVGFQAEDMPNQKMRREFYMWADENNLIWGEMES